MKKVLYILTALLFVFVLMLGKAPQRVSAGMIESLPIAPSTWTGGTEVKVDLETYPAPDWLELKSEGVKVTTPGQICHEFRGSPYHWNPEIRMLKNGVWVKVASTGSWVPNEEGIYVVCANASAVGTYALFAYYNGPAEYFVTEEAPL